MFKQQLNKHLGSDWYRLACAMGLPKTNVDSIDHQTNIDLPGKIDEFLGKYQFPAFRSDDDTTEFLVEALERAYLSNIAAAVKRDLKDALQREGMFVCMQTCVVLSYVALASTCLASLFIHW